MSASARGRSTTSTNLVGHGLRSDDSRERMEEAVDIIGRLWGGGHVSYSGKYFQVQVPELRPRPVQRPHLPLWRSVISPASFSEWGRLGLPARRSGDGAVSLLVNAPRRARRQECRKHPVAER